MATAMLFTFCLEIVLLGPPAGGNSVRLVAIMAKHVDDLKITGEKAVIVWVIEQLQKEFGQLKMDWNNFTNCGVRHRQDTTTKTVVMDQDDYIKGIKLCVHAGQGM